MPTTVAQRIEYMGRVIEEDGDLQMSLATGNAEAAWQPTPDAFEFRYAGHQL